MAGNITATYKVTCALCDETREITDERQYISPRLATDFVAACKDYGWAVTLKGWTCPTCKDVDPRQTRMKL